MSGREPPEPARFRPMSAAEQDLVRRRQRSNARLMGVLLAALAVLVFLITVAKQTG